MSLTPSFLVVDDDRAVVANIKAILVKSFPESFFSVAYNSGEAWNILQKEDIDIVVCDYDLPDENGLQLCQRLRSKPNLSSIYFIMTTALSEPQIKIKALETCVDDFIQKPIEVDEFIARLRSAVRILSLQSKLKADKKLLQDLAKALKEHIEDSKKLAFKILVLRLPSLEDLLRKVSQGAVWVAKMMGEFEIEEIEDIEFASKIAYLGKLCLPDSLIYTPVLTDGRPTNQLMCQVPVKTKELLSDISGFSSIGRILYHVYENFDGSGIPDKLQSWQIPIESRIIRIVLDYEEMRFFKKVSVENALEHIKTHSRKFYDPKIVIYFEQYLLEFKEFRTGFEHKPIGLQDLAEGMVLANDLVTKSGLKLLPAGTTLNSKLIELILSHNTTDPILGNVYVKIH
ncbi:MAG: response regulator [Candidatus Kapaibacteriales bacterium]